MTKLSNCVVRGAGNAFPPCIFVSGLLVQDTYVEIADMDHKSETSFTTCHIKAQVKQTNIGSPLLLPKYDWLEFGPCIQESVNCGFNWTISNLPFFLKRSLSVWLQSFFFGSSTKASFPTESTTAIN